jgi:uncharacterized protein
VLDPKRIVWDPAKAAKNLRDHKISFEFAKDIFFDPYAIEYYDATHSDAEDRFRILGRVASRIFLVVYSERDTEIRMISARLAERAERKRYYENEKEQSHRP